jgi:hypothetical protein
MSQVWLFDAAGGRTQMLIGPNPDTETAYTIEDVLKKS